MIVYKAKRSLAEDAMKRVEELGSPETYTVGRYRRCRKRKVDS